MLFRSKISDNHRKAVTAQLLENQERFLREERAFLTEAPPTTSLGNGGASAGTPGFSGGSTDAGPVAGFDPVLISLIRRAMPNLVAYDLAGVQPMNGPTGLIFAMRTRYDGQSGREAFFNEPDSAFSAQDSDTSLTQGDYVLNTTDGGTDVGFGTTAQGQTPATDGTNPSILNGGSANAYNVGQGFDSTVLETLGDAAANDFREMSFSIEKVTVAARSRALKAEYSLELAQDLKAIHGLDAEAELANILSTEILAEINREIIRTIYKVARPGAQTNTA